MGRCNFHRTFSLYHIRLWDVVSQNPKTPDRLLDGTHSHGGAVWKVIFSADGKLLASASNDKTIKIWDVASDKFIIKLADFTTPVYDVAFSKDDKYLIGGSFDGTVKIWSVSNWDLVASINNADFFNGVRTVSFSFLDNIILVGTLDGKVIILDWQSDKELQKLPSSEDYNDSANPTLSLDISKENELVFSHNDGQISWYNCYSEFTQCSLTYFSYPSAITASSYSSDGHFFVLGQEDGMIQIRDAQTNSIQKVFYSGYEGVMALAFSPNNQNLASLSSDGLVRVWDVNNSKVLNIFRPNQNINSLAFSTDGKSLFSFGSKIDLWSLKLNQLISENSGYNISSAVYSPNGEYLAIKLADKDLVLVLDAQTGVELHQISTDAEHLTFSPDSETLAYANKEVNLYNLITGINKTIYKNYIDADQKYESDIEKIVFNPHEPIVTVITEGNLLISFNVDDPKFVSRQEADSNITSLSYAPDGRTLVTGSIKGILTIWLVAS